MSDQTNTPAEAEIETKGQANGQDNGQAGAETAPEAVAVPPEERIAKLEAEVASLKDQLLRAMAETENTRRRAQRDREDASKYAVASFAKDLAAVADNLRRALEAVPPEGREQDEMLKSLAVGVEATERQLLGAFERAGIKKVDPTGETFDPNFHQVMFEIENTGKAPGTVVQVLQPGYTIHGRLLREAMVGVAKASPEEPQRVDTTA
ncbi:MAG TPA: nucleotide exchange factor GrpE [Azospirillum sp.]|nr:nucleotide exchange factor GrpE [Azospirillum sp.]